MNTILALQLFFPITAWSIFKTIVVVLAFYLGYKLTQNKGKKYCRVFDVYFIIITISLVLVKFLVAPFFVSFDGKTQHLLTLLLLISLAIIFGTAFSDWHKKRKEKKR